MSNPNNRVYVCGRVGCAPEIKTLTTGKRVAKFSLYELVKKGDPAVIHQIVAWDKGVDLTEKYVSQGRVIGVHGRLSYNKYTDKNGSEQCRAEIVEDDYQLFPASTIGKEAEKYAAPGPSEDLPFDE